MKTSQIDDKNQDSDDIAGLSAYLMNLDSKEKKSKQGLNLFDMRISVHIAPICFVVDRLDDDLKMESFSDDVLKNFIKHLPLGPTENRAIKDEKDFSGLSPGDCQEMGQLFAQIFENYYDKVFAFDVMRFVTHGLASLRVSYIDLFRNCVDLSPDDIADLRKAESSNDLGLHHFCPNLHHQELDKKRVVEWLVRLIGDQKKLEEIRVLGCHLQLVFNSKQIRNSHPGSHATYHVLLHDPMLVMRAYVAQHDQNMLWLGAPVKKINKAGYLCLLCADARSNWAKDDCESLHGTKSNFTRHVKNTHDPKRFPCLEPDCPKDFASAEGRKAHMKREHEKSARSTDRYRKRSKQKRDNGNHQRRKKRQKLNEMKETGPPPKKRKISNHGSSSISLVSSLSTDDKMSDSSNNASPVGTKNPEIPSFIQSFNSEIAQMRQNEQGRGANVDSVRGADKQADKKQKDQITDNDTDLVHAGVQKDDKAQNKDVGDDENDAVNRAEKHVHKQQKDQVTEKVTDVVHARVEEDYQGQNEDVGHNVNDAFDRADELAHKLQKDQDTDNDAHLVHAGVEEDYQGQNEEVGHHDNDAVDRADELADKQEKDQLADNDTELVHGRDEEEDQGQNEEVGDNVIVVVTGADDGIEKSQKNEAGGSQNDGVNGLQDEVETMEKEQGIVVENLFAADDSEDESNGKGSVPDSDGEQNDAMEEKEAGGRNDHDNEGTL